jgi:toxin YoeB
MEVKYSEDALQDIAYWKQNGNASVLKKISALVRSIEKDPFRGIGKPEPLKYELSGKWSRRITATHRLVYQITDCIEILSLRGHYDRKQF